MRKLIIIVPFIIMVGLVALLYPHDNSVDKVFAGLSLTRIKSTVGEGAEFTLVFINTTNVALKYQVQYLGASFNQQRIRNVHVALIDDGAIVAAGQEGMLELTVGGISQPIDTGRIVFTLTYGPLGGTQIFRSHYVLEIHKSIVTGRLTWIIVSREDSRL